MEAAPSREDEWFAANRAANRKHTELSNKAQEVFVLRCLLDRAEREQKALDAEHGVLKQRANDLLVELDAADA